MHARHLSFLTLLCLGSVVAASLPVLPISFEERDRTLFIARSGNGSVHIHSDRVVLGRTTLLRHWIGPDQPAECG